MTSYADLLAHGGYDGGEIGFRVMMNGGERRFTERTSASSRRILGRRLYESLMLVDLNADGFLDAVATYSTKPYGADPGFSWGTTFFFNDGTGAFRVVDGTHLLPTATTNPPRGDERWSLGSFFPTRNRARKLAIVMIGGLVTSTLFTLLALPTFYSLVLGLLAPAAGSLTGGPKVPIQ